MAEGSVSEWLSNSRAGRIDAPPVGGAREARWGLLGNFSSAVDPLIFFNSEEGPGRLGGDSGNQVGLGTQVARDAGEAGGAGPGFEVIGVGDAIGFVRIGLESNLQVFAQDLEIGDDDGAGGIDSEEREVKAERALVRIVAEDLDRMGADGGGIGAEGDGEIDGGSGGHDGGGEVDGTG